MSVRVLQGDCRSVLKTLADNSVHAVVTSPPYFGLRDYLTATWDGGDPLCDHQQNVHLRRDSPGGFHNSTSRGTQAGTIAGAKQYAGECGKCGARRIDAQIGLEQSPDLYVAEMVAVFREVRRVLRDDGTCWINIGDSYNSQNGFHRGDKKHMGGGIPRVLEYPDRNVPDLAPKQLLMMPARVALALQADGWWLRSDIIWHKVAPMPESVRDRPTRSHEHVFLLTKRERYFYNAAEARDPLRQTSVDRLTQPSYADQEGSDRANGGAKTNGKMKAVAAAFGGRVKSQINDQTRLASGNDWEQDPAAGANWRDVWSIASEGYDGAHFAVMPAALAERCVKAGSKLGDVVLDPFAGAFTSCLVADRLQRNAIGIELSATYCEMARNRLTQDAGMFAEIAAE